jgi:3-oxoacyl-[acyl-carrier-protein] synthase-3
VSGKVVIGTGSYVPECIVSNDEIERTSLDWDPQRAGMSLDRWCRERIGAIERRRVKPGEGTSDMATRAAAAALTDAGLSATGIDVIVLATVTSDYTMPPSASILQRNLGTSARFLQVDSACTGFLDALMLADGVMDTMGYRTALVVGADTMSMLLDRQRFREQTIFGDGAGAVVLRSDGSTAYGTKAYSTGSSGADGFMVEVRGGGSKQPFSPEMLESRDQYIRLAKTIPPYGVAHMVQAVHEVLERAQICLADIDWIVPHQASWNIVRDTATALNLPIGKFVLNFDCFGNTSAGSIPLTLDYGNRQRLFRDGQKILLPAVGAGMAWGAAYLVWHDYRAARDGSPVAEASGIPN